MKKILIVFLIILAFIFGLKLADDGTSTSKLLEKDKILFEEEIKKPNNDYKPKEYVPDENIVNKTAHKIDNAIEKIVEKFKSILKKI